jgi:hypothetical protein
VLTREADLSADLPSGLSESCEGEEALDAGIHHDGAWFTAAPFGCDTRRGFPLRILSASNEAPALVDGRRGAPRCAIAGTRPIATAHPRVLRVIDSDTIDVQLADGSCERVRIIGLDTPETVDPRKPVQCSGREASNQAKELLTPGHAVILEQDVARRAPAAVARVPRRVLLELAPGVPRL